MQPALDSLKNPISQEVTKLVEKIPEAPKPQNWQKINNWFVISQIYFVVVRSHQKPMYEWNLESSLLLNFFIRHNLIVQIFQKSRKNLPLWKIQRILLLAKGGNFLKEFVFIFFREAVIAVGQDCWFSCKSLLFYLNYLYLNLCIIFKYNECVLFYFAVLN